MTDTTDPSPAAAGRLTVDQYMVLKAPINPHHVRWHGEETDPNRSPYLEGTHVRRELTRVFGFANWDEKIVAEQVIDDSAATIEVDDVQVEGWRVIRATRIRLIVKAADGAVLTVREATAIYTAEHRDRGMAHHQAATSSATIALKIAARAIADRFGIGLLAGIVAAPYVAGSWVRPEGVPLPVREPATAGEPPVDVLSGPDPTPDANPSADGETPGWRRVAAAGFKFHDPAAITASLRETIAAAKAAKVADADGGLNGKAQVAA